MSDQAVLTKNGSTVAAREMMADSLRHESLVRRLKLGFWWAVVVFGAAGCWIDRNYTNTDGISYLDVASAFQRHDWSAAINAYWSPLYPFLLSLILRISRPTPFKEFAVVHLVNFMVFLAAAGAFQFFIRKLLEWRRRIATQDSTEAQPMMPEWALLLLGYALFIWSGMTLITVSDVSPDMLVAAFVFLAAGIIAAMKTGEATAQQFCLLGVVLGLGYLAKAPMLPMGAVFLAMAVVASGQLREGLTRVPAALICFVLVAGPFIAALSHFQGRFTWGDSAKLNYAWYVDHVPRYHWHGEVRGVGTPLHPTAKLNASPAVYAFDGPGESTYAIWFDPAYWNAGVRPRFELGSNVKQIVTNVGVYADVFFGQEAAVLVVCALLFLLGSRGARAIADLAEYAVILLPVLAALGMYALVHVETRMIGAYAVIFWLALFAAVKSRPSETGNRAAACGSVAITLFALVMLASSLMAETVTKGRAQLMAWNNANALPEWRVVNELNHAGIKPGDRVAWVRPNELDANLQNYAWAKLAGVRIIAEVPGSDAEGFWGSAPTGRAAVLEALRRTPAKALIVTKTPAGFAEAGWHQLGTTGFEVYLLNSSSE